MLITVLMFLFQTSFHSYFLTNLILKSEILQIDSNLVQGYIATCFMFVYMFIHIYIYIYIYIYIWKHFQTPCIVHHTLLYIILQELNVFDNDLRRKYNELECKIFQIYLKVRSNKIRNYWDLIALVWN